MNELIKISNFEIIQENEERIFKLYYEYFGESEIKIKIYVQDAIFRSSNIWNSNIVRKGVQYWTTFSANSSVSNTYFNMDVNISIYDEKDSHIHFEKLPFVLTDFTKRKIGLPNFWVIGDSHVGFLFKEIDKKDLFQIDFVINYISQLELSLNLFLNSDWKIFLRTIPIRDNDTLAFLLGDIELRFSIIWKTIHVVNDDERRKNLENILNKILIKYVQVIEEIKLIYPNCKIIVLTPPPPLRNNTISDEELLINSEKAEKDRLFLHEEFNSFFIKSNIEYWNCMNDYIDNDGFMKNYFLYENNHHIKDGIPFITQLKLNQQK